MFSNFTSFKDIDFENLNDQNSQLEDRTNGIFTSFLEKHDVNPTTFEEDSFGLENFVMSRNPHTDDRDYEISFESTFLEEHQNAFKKQTENFIESSFKFSEQKEITFESEQIFGNGLQFSSFAIQEEKIKEMNKSQTFLTNIKKEEKLSQFVQFIYQSVPKQFANQLIYLASVAYNKHTETKEDEQSECQIVKKAKELANKESEKIFESQKIKYLNFKNVSSKELNHEFIIKAAFKSYLQFFFATVMLVSEEYFQNLYGQEECGKRARCFSLEDDEENEYSSTGSYTFGKPSKKSH